MTTSIPAHKTRSQIPAIRQYRKALTTYSFSEIKIRVFINYLSKVIKIPLMWEWIFTDWYCSSKIPNKNNCSIAIVSAIAAVLDTQNSQHVNEQNIRLDFI